MTACTCLDPGSLLGCGTKDDARRLYQWSREDCEVHRIMGESEAGVVAQPAAQVALGVASSPTSHMDLRCPKCGDVLTAGVQSRRTATGYTNTPIYMCRGWAYLDACDYVIPQAAPRQAVLL